MDPHLPSEEEAACTALSSQRTAHHEACSVGPLGRPFRLLPVPLPQPPCRTGWSWRDRVARQRHTGASCLHEYIRNTEQALTLSTAKPLGQSEKDELCGTGMAALRTGLSFLASPKPTQAVGADALTLKRLYRVTIIIIIIITLHEMRSWLNQDCQAIWKCLD